MIGWHLVPVTVGTRGKRVSPPEPPIVGGSFVDGMAREGQAQNPAEVASEKRCFLGHAGVSEALEPGARRRRQNTPAEQFPCQTPSARQLAPIRSGRPAPGSARSLLVPSQRAHRRALPAPRGRQSLFPGRLVSGWK